jgi:ferric-dicitrate binding protein FerR (iron transport regulator)
MHPSDHEIQETATRLFFQCPDRDPTQTELAHIAAWRREDPRHDRAYNRAAEAWFGLELAPSVDYWLTPEVTARGDSTRLTRQRLLQQLFWPIIGIALIPAAIVLFFLIQS